jgi:hypothetical protein
VRYGLAHLWINVRSGAQARKRRADVDTEELERKVARYQVWRSTGILVYLLLEGHFIYSLVRSTAVCYPGGGSMTSYPPSDNSTWGYNRLFHVFNATGQALPNSAWQRQPHTA